MNPIQINACIDKLVNDRIIQTQNDIIEQMVIDRINKRDNALIEQRVIDHIAIRDEERISKIRAANKKNYNAYRSRNVEKCKEVSRGYYQKNKLIKLALKEAIETQKYQELEAAVILRYQQSEANKKEEAELIISNNL